VIAKNFVMYIVILIAKCAAIIYTQHSTLISVSLIAYLAKQAAVNQK
jgi:hypothetical protein